MSTLSILGYGFGRLLFASCLACASGGELGPGGGGQGGEGADAASHEQPGPASLELVLRQDTAERRPVGAAHCAVELDDGAVHEQPTDGSGSAWFDLSRAPESYSVVCAKHHVAGLAGLRWEALERAQPTRQRVELAIEPDPASLHAPRTVAFFGELLGDAKPWTQYLVQATSQIGNRHRSVQRHFALSVELGRPFQLLTVEHVFGLSIRGWTVSLHHAPTEDSVYDLEPVGNVEPVRVRGSVGLPRELDGPFFQPLVGGRLETRSWDALHDVAVGFSTRAAFVADRLEYDAESYQGIYPPDEVDTELELACPVCFMPASSKVVLGGYPPSGDLALRFLDTPRVVEPRAPAPLEGALLRWQVGGVEPRALSIEDTGGARYTLRWPAGLSEITLPKLPSKGVGLERGLLLGRLVAEDELPREGPAWRTVHSAPIELVH